MRVTLQRDVGALDHHARGAVATHRVDCDSQSLRHREILTATRPVYCNCPPRADAARRSTDLYRSGRRRGTATVPVPIPNTDAREDVASYGICGPSDKNVTPSRRPAPCGPPASRTDRKSVV